VLAVGGGAVTDPGPDERRRVELEPSRSPNLTRRKFLALAGGAPIALAFVRPLRGLARLGISRGSMRRTSVTPLTPGERLTMRSLWDAAVPGTWNGVVEDTLASGVAAPGADDAKVQDWIESLEGSLPAPFDAFASGFMKWWADDLDLWADWFHWPIADSAPKFYELPLGPTLRESGRQYKVMLMSSIFGGTIHTIFDLKYLGAMAIAKAAFYCDFWSEKFDPQTRVGRKYIGFPLPPGTTPRTDFTYNRVLGDAEARLIRVNREFVALP
jgi:hypothetical protein